MASFPLLEFENVSLKFPVYRGLFRKVTGYVRAVEGLSLKLSDGEIHALVGESGCGKSSAGRLAVRLLPPTSGRVLHEARTAEELSKEERKEDRRDYQIIFQDPYASLNPRKTILEAIGEGVLYHRLAANEAEQKEVVAKILSEVGLGEEVMHRYPHQFSGGQQQRICIARALALKPRLLVCDEALSALDLSVQAQILNLLGDLKAAHGLSYLFISHDLNTVRHFSDHVTVMYLGQIMEQGPTASIFEHPKHPYTQALLASVPKRFPEEKKERQVLGGDPPSNLSPPSGCPFRTRCPYAEPRCAEAIPRKQGPGEGHIYDCIL